MNLNDKELKSLQDGLRVQRTNDVVMPGMTKRTIIHPFEHGFFVYVNTAFAGIILVNEISGGQAPVYNISRFTGIGYTALVMRDTLDEAKQYIEDQHRPYPRSFE